MMGFTDMPRTGLGFFPTPVQELKRLSSLLGGSLFQKGCQLIGIGIDKEDMKGDGLGNLSSDLPMIRQN
jgi:hypothetical protein